jgi:hypothetical protein
MKGDTLSAGNDLTSPPDLSGNRTGKSRGITSNGRDEADSGKKEEGCRTRNRMETVGNNSGKTATGSEKFRKHPYVFSGTGIENAGS